MIRITVFIIPGWLRKALQPAYGLAGWRRWHLPGSLGLGLAEPDEDGHDDDDDDGDDDGDCDDDDDNDDDRGKRGFPEHQYLQSQISMVVATVYKSPSEFLAWPGWTIHGRYSAVDPTKHATRYRFKRSSINPVQLDAWSTWWHTCWFEMSAKLLKFRPITPFQSSHTNPIVGFIQLLCCAGKPPCWLHLVTPLCVT